MTVNPAGITVALIDALAYLVPGLVAAEIFYALAARVKPGVFGQIAHALIFMVAAQLLVGLLSIPSDLASLQLIASFAVAFLLALVLSLVLKHDLFHRLMRLCRITKESSFPSIWYSAFANTEPGFVVLHLKDGSRLYGWPREWPSRSDADYFRMEDPEWLPEDPAADGASAGSQPGAWMLVPVTLVELVEYVPCDNTSQED